MPAVLTRRVMIKGSILLTNHRMCFIAYLPSHETLSSPESVPSTGQSKPIKRGPATLHRPGLHRKKRMWLERESLRVLATSASLELTRMLAYPRSTP